MIQIPLRSTLYTMTDLNDRVGVPADGGDDQSVTGGGAPEADGLAATFLRRVLQDEGVVVLKHVQKASRHL